MVRFRRGKWRRLRGIGGGLHRLGTGGVDVSCAALFGQLAEPHDAAQRFGTSGVERPLGPVAGGFPQGCGSRAPVVGTFLDGAMQAPNAQATAEFSWFQAHMAADLLHVVVEQTHHPAVPAHPDFPPDPLRRCFVIRLGNFHETVALHASATLLVTLVNRCRQRPKRLALLLEDGCHLPPGGAMHALVGHMLLPVKQVGVLLGKRGELPPLERVVFGVGNSAFDLALVLRRMGSAGHRCHAIITAKIRQFRVHCRVIPIRLDHRRLEVIEIEQTRHTAEIAHGIFDHPQECLGVLAQHHLAVALARVA